VTTSDVMTEGRSADEVLAWSRTAVEPALRAAVDTLPSAMRRIAGYHFGWWNEHGQPDLAPGVKSTGGKAIRPALVLLSAQAVGGVPAVAGPSAGQLRNACRRSRKNVEACNRWAALRADHRLPSRNAYYLDIWQPLARYRRNTMGSKRGMRTEIDRLSVNSRSARLQSGCLVVAPSVAADCA